MKKFNIFVFFTLCLILVNLSGFALTLTSFVVEPQYLSNGDVLVNTSTKAILIDISFTRSLLPQTQLF